MYRAYLTRGNLVILRASRHCTNWLAEYAEYRQYKQRGARTQGRGKRYDNICVAEKTGIFYDAENIAPARGCAHARTHTRTHT